MGYKRPRVNVKGQVVMEFTFSIFIIFLFVYGFIKVFQWSGVGLAERSQVHDKVLTRSITENWNGTGNQLQGPLGQISTDYYKSRKIKAVWGEEQ